jgi:hypothetical protein
MFPLLLSSGPVLGALYVAYTAAFYLRVSTAKATNPIATSRGGSPDQDALLEYRGLIHVHSEYSHDARGSYDELAHAAHRHGLAFLVVTDHNNVDAIAADEQGWRNGVLLLTGVESRRREGYMLFVDIENYIHKTNSSTCAALQERLPQGGFGLVVHAGNCRRPWNGDLDPAIAGLEILDYADQLYDCSALAKLNAFLFYPANRALACLRVYHRPTETLARWDREASARPVVGFYGPNMHQNVRILKWEPKFPPADAVMPLASNHILSREPFTGDFQSDRRIVYTAIRNGNLFFALDILGDSNGFRFSATQEGRSAIMGEVLVADVETVFSIRLPRIESNSRLEIVVYRDGVEFLRKRGHDLTFRATRAGAYRVEVLARVPTFFGQGRVAPWIYSNPIYLRSRSFRPARQALSV